MLRYNLTHRQARLSNRLRKRSAPPDCSDLLASLALPDIPAYLVYLGAGWSGPDCEHCRKGSNRGYAVVKRNS